MGRSPVVTGAQDPQRLVPTLDLGAQVSRAMDEVMDPHMSVSLNEMGMVNRVDVDADGVATISLVFPCVGCPAFDVIQHDAKQAAERVPGIKRARIKLDWGASWDKSKMSDSAREHAKHHGYVI